MGKGGGLGRETAQYVCYEVQNGKKWEWQLLKRREGIAEGEKEMNNIKMLEKH